VCGPYDAEQQQYNGCVGLMMQSSSNTMGVWAL
jgi:hypothetical protein